MSVTPGGIRIRCDQFYAIAETFDPQLRYEILDGTIYRMSPAKLPHAGVATFFENRFAVLDRTKYLVRTERRSKSNRTALLSASHPCGSDAQLVIEVGDSERKPRENMRAYMHDGGISTAWRIDLPGRRVEIWRSANTIEPAEILFGSEAFGFGEVTFTVDAVFQTVLHR